MATSSELPSCPKLSAIVTAVGGEAASEFEMLFELARIGAAVQAAIGGMPKTMGEATRATTPSPPTAPRPRGRPRKLPKAEEDPVGRLNVQLDLLRAEAEGETALESAYKASAERLGGEGKNARRVAGTLLARTHGGHRPNFLSRLQAAGLLTDSLCTELARLYSKIEGKKVTAEQLLREARSAKR